MALYLADYNQANDTFAIASTDAKGVRISSREHVIKALASGMEIVGLRNRNGYLITEPIIEIPANNGKTSYVVCSAGDSPNYHILDRLSKRVYKVTASSMRLALLKRIKISGARIAGSRVNIEMDSVIYNNILDACDSGYYVGERYSSGYIYQTDKLGVDYVKEVKFNNRDCIVVSYIEKINGGSSRSYDGFRYYDALIDKETLAVRKFKHVYSYNTDEVLCFADGLYINDNRIIPWRNKMCDVRFSYLQVLFSNDCQMLIFTRYKEGKSDDGEFTDKYLYVLDITGKANKWIIRDLAMDDIAREYRSIQSLLKVKENTRILENGHDIISFLKSIKQ